MIKTFEILSVPKSFWMGVGSLYMVFICSRFLASVSCRAI